MPDASHVTFTVAPSATALRSDTAPVGALAGADTSTFLLVEVPSPALLVGVSFTVYVAAEDPVAVNVHEVLASVMLAQVLLVTVPPVIKAVMSRPVVVPQSVTPALLQF